MHGTASGPVFSVAAMWLQEIGTSTDAHLTMIFVGIIALCFVVIAVIILILAIASFRVVKMLATFAHDTLRKANPAIASATEFVHVLEPHVRRITTNVSAITDTVKSKVDQFDNTLTDVNDRTKAQVARVDGLVNEAVTTTAEIAGTIQRGIRAPIREVSGLVAGAKAFFDVLYGRNREASVNDASRAAASVTNISSRGRPIASAPYRERPGDL